MIMSRSGLAGPLPTVCPWSSSIGAVMNCGFDSSAQSMLAASVVFDVHAFDPAVVLGSRFPKR